MGDPYPLGPPASSPPAVLRHPVHVRARVLLEADAPRELAPATARWVDALGDRLRRWRPATAPALLVGAADSPRGPRADRALPNARTVLVEGGHLIDPAHPAVLDFIAAL